MEGVRWAGGDVPSRLAAPKAAGPIAGRGAAHLLLIPHSKSHHMVVFLPISSINITKKGNILGCTVSFFWRKFYLEPKDGVG